MASEESKWEKAKMRTNRSEARGAPVTATSYGDSNMISSILVTLQMPGGEVSLASRQRKYVEAFSTAEEERKG